MEITLEIAKFLDDQSLVALRHTNHDLFCTIIPTVDQLSRVREARYLVEFVKLTNGANENRLGICTDCHELQPFTAFSISETKALGKLRDASCLRHAQFWMCPHVSYSYEEIIDLQFSGRALYESTSYVVFQVVEGRNVDMSSITELIIQEDGPLSSGARFPFSKLHILAAQVR